LQYKVLGCCIFYYCSIWGRPNWSEIIDGYNTTDAVVKDGRTK